MADSIQADAARYEWLSLSTFGYARKTQRKVRVVGLGLRLKDGSSKKIEASVLPHITNTITQQGIPAADIMALQELGTDNLADTINLQEVDRQIDVLIGTDFLWEFMAGSTRGLPSGLQLLPTTVGFVVTGRTRHSKPSAAPISSTAMPAIVSLTDATPDSCTIPDLWDLDS